MGLGSKLRILSICDDEDISISRELVLKHEGYEVESICSKPAIEPHWVKEFQIAILCHSLSSACAGRISLHLRRYNSAIRILRLSTADSERFNLYDEECEAFSHPEALLKAIQSLSEVCRNSIFEEPKTLDQSTFRHLILGTKFGDESRMEAEANGATAITHDIVETRDFFLVHRVFTSMDSFARSFLWDELGIDHRIDRDEIPDRNTLTGREFLLHELHRSAANSGGLFFIVVERSSDGVSEVFVTHQKATAQRFCGQRLIERT